MTLTVRTPNDDQATVDANAPRTPKWVLEQLPAALKVTGTAGSVCGFIYLFAYTRSSGIPFPMELSVLPSMLLLVGITSVIAMTILVGGLLVPALMADEPISVTKSYFLVEDANVTPARRRWIRLLRYLGCSWMPMVLALAALLFSQQLGGCEWESEVATTLVALSVIWIAVTPFVVKDFAGKRLKYTSITLLQTILSLAAYCLAIILLVALYPESRSWPEIGALVGVLAVFTLIHMAITLPHRNGTILLPPHFENQVAPATTFIFVFAACATALSLFMEPASAKVGKTALYAFGIGGGVPVRICLKGKPPAAIDKQFAFGEDYCSEVAAMLFDAGDKVYIAKSDSETDASKDAKSPRREFVYFKQDEIRAKIFPAPAAKRNDEPAPNKRCG